MADRETIMSIVGLLRQGWSSASIAKELKVSEPTVWDVKWNLSQGKYGDKPPPVSECEEVGVGYDPAKKSAAILAGYWRTVASQSGTPGDAAVEFSRLLALITSPRKADRDKAKNEIRNFAEKGGWENISKASASQSTAITDDSENHPAIKQPNRVRRWTDEEEKRLINYWTASDCARDEKALQQVSDLIKRTPLAVVCRLFKIGLISIDQGDALCISANTSKLLSKTNLVNPKVDKSNQLAEIAADEENVDSEESLADEVTSERLCISCSRPIPASRLILVPHALRCARCQSDVEKNTDYHQYIDEGLAGTREAHKILRGNLMSDIIKRTKD